jgi:hypothetical protein
VESNFGRPTPSTRCRREVDFHTGGGEERSFEAREKSCRGGRRRGGGRGPGVGRGDTCLGLVAGRLGLAETRQASPGQGARRRRRGTRCARRHERGCRRSAREARRTRSGCCRDAARVASRSARLHGLQCGPRGSATGRAAGGSARAQTACEGRRGADSGGRWSGGGLLAAAAGDGSARCPRPAAQAAERVIKFMNDVA